MSPRCPLAGDTSKSSPVGPRIGVGVVGVAVVIYQVFLSCLHEVSIILILYLFVVQNAVYEHSSRANRAVELSTVHSVCGMCIRPLMALHSPFAPTARNLMIHTWYLSYIFVNMFLYFVGYLLSYSSTTSSFVVRTTSMKYFSFGPLGTTCILLLYQVYTAVVAANKTTNY